MKGQFGDRGYKRIQRCVLVGAVCSAWVEIKNGLYLQGKGGDHIFETYTCKGELPIFKSTPNLKLMDLNRKVGFLGKDLKWLLRFKI